MHVHIAAGLRRIQFGIQYFRRRLTAHIVQVHHAGQGNAHAAVAYAHGYAAVSHDRRNGMGCGSVHHYAGLHFFLTAILQPAYAIFLVVSLSFCKGTAGPGIPAYRAVNEVFILVRVVFQRAGRLNFIAVAAFGGNGTVFDPGIGMAGQFIIGTRHAQRRGGALPAGGHVQHTGIVGDGFVALRHYAHITGTVNIRLLNFRCRIIFNIVMAAGTAYGRCSFHRHGSAHGHAENFAFGRSADIQIANVHGCSSLLVGIGHPCCRGIFDAVHAYRHHAGQEGIRPGKLHGRRAGL